MNGEQSIETGLQKFNIEELLLPLPHRTNLNVAFVDDAYAFRIAKIRDTFPAHTHPNGDEGWFVYRGRMRIDSELGSVELGAGEGTVMPKGVLHSPTCLEDDTLVLVINVKGFETIPADAAALAASGFSEYDLPKT